MPDSHKQLEELMERIQSSIRFLDLDEKRKKARELEAQSMKSDLWNDPQHARTVTQELSRLQELISVWEKLESDAKSLHELAASVKGDEDLERDVAEHIGLLEKSFREHEFDVLLSGEHDSSNAILAIHAGAGGVDAMDWAGMLLRMYMRFCDRKGFKVEVVTESRGQEAGIKSCMLRIEGSYAFGFLKSEAGVHRLVRISPFDAEKMRHTSFALVEVLPELEELGEIDVKDDDIRIDTFMSGGHGGQSVNTTYSAVRMVHIPTGITVSCQNERSQAQNKMTAMKILKSKLHAYYKAELDEEKAALRGEFKEAAWGNQIRSYVIHPYKMVKDHRTDFETSDTEKVLEGGLEDFMDAYLRSGQESK